MENQQFHARLTIDQDKLDRLNRIMNTKPTDFGAYSEEMWSLIEDVEYHIGRTGSSFYSNVMDFPDGKSIKLEVCAPETRDSFAYAKATLYDIEDKTISTKISHQLDGAWLLTDKDKGRLYTVDVQPERMREQADEPIGFHAIMTVEPEKLARMNRIMAFEQIDHYESWGNLDMNDPDVREFAEICNTDQEFLFKQEVPFSNGYHAEVVILPPENIDYKAYAQAYLYDDKGVEIDYTDTYSELDEGFDFRDEDGNTYIIEVEEKERTTDKTMCKAYSEHKGSFKFNASLPIAPEELAHMNRLMIFEPTDYVEEGDEECLHNIKDPAVDEFLDSAGAADPLYSEEVAFPNGNTAVLSVFPPEDEHGYAYAEATLFDKNQDVIDRTEDRCQLNGRWELTDGENTYTIDAKEKKREIDRSPMGERLSSLRQKVFQVLKAPVYTSDEEERRRAYALLMHDLPEALSGIKQEFSEHSLKMPINERMGDYLCTGHLDGQPFGTKAQEEAKKLVPALYAFSKKMETVHKTLLASASEPSRVSSVPPDMIQYTDAATELQKATPQFLRSHLRIEGSPFPYPEKEWTIYQEATKSIDYLRGNSCRIGKETLAERTMRKVYSAHKDTVDYEKLNEETVAKLVEKGASEKTIRDVAEIAKTINPSIQDTKAYVKHLTDRAKARGSLNRA